MTGQTEYAQAECHETRNDNTPFAHLVSEQRLGEGIHSTRPTGLLPLSLSNDLDRSI